MIDMQTLEAIISFTFFLLFASYLLQQLDYAKPNYSLQQYQAANDVWRVLYLKGALKDFPANAPLLMNEVGEKTGLCIYVQGTQTTNCRGGPRCSENKIAMQKAWFEDSVAKQLDFSVCTPQQP